MLIWIRAERRLLGPSFSFAGSLRQGTVFLVMFPSHVRTLLLTAGGYLLIGRNGPWHLALVLTASLALGWWMETIGVGPRLLRATGLATLVPGPAQKLAAHGARLWNAPSPDVLWFASPYARIYVHWFSPTVAISDALGNALSEEELSAVLGRVAADVAPEKQRISWRWAIAALRQGVGGVVICLLLEGMLALQEKSHYEGEQILYLIYVAVAFAVTFSLVLIYATARETRRTRWLDRAAGLPVGITALEALERACEINLTACF